MTARTRSATPLDPVTVAPRGDGRSDVWIRDNITTVDGAWEADETHLVMDGTPSPDEVLAARAEATARLDDILARIERIEAHLWPPAPEPEPGQAVDPWADVGGVWPSGSIIEDGGRLWRNVTTVPLTTAPSGFPGGPDKWAHLFVEVKARDPKPDPKPTAWATGVAYAVGAVVTYAGASYRARQAHTSQTGWDPVAVPALWEKI